MITREEAEMKGIEQKGIKSYLSDPFIWFIIFGFLGMLFYYGRLPVYKQDTAIMYFAGLLITVYFMKQTWLRIKHGSPKVVWANGYSTTHGFLYQVGNWAVIRLGGVNWGLWARPGNSGIIVCPWTAAYKKGLSIVANVRARDVDIGALPDIVRKNVISEGLNPPYKLGYADDDLYHSIPELETLTNELEESSRRNYMLNAMLRGNKTIIEGEVKSMGRISDRVTTDKGLKRHIVKPKEQEY